MKRFIFGIAAVAVVVGFAPASASAGAEPGGKQPVIDFSGDVDAADVVTVAPKGDIDFQPLIRSKYGKREDLSGKVPGFEDPLPLKQKRNGCGACSAGGEGPGVAGLVVLGALMLPLVRRRRRR